MNSVRLAKKNILAFNVISLFVIARIIVMIINRKQQNCFAFLIALSIVFFIGNLVFYKINDRSEYMKYTTVTLYAVITVLSLLLSGEVSDALPIFISMGMCIVYMDVMQTGITCGLSIVGVLIETIIQLSKNGFSSSIIWIELCILVVVFTVGIIMACNLTLRDQETDKQEIQYHVAYQEEITASMVKVVDNGNAHINLLQKKLDNFQNATEEVSRSVDAISDGVNDTVSNMETSTNMTQQIQDIIDNLIDVKDSSVDSANQAVEAIQKGLDVIENLKNKSNDIYVANEDVTRVSEELCEKIVSAEEITELIYQISKQTNLLALNASIEAARAGEAGRGFAVVADEIRKLADDTKSSIDSISELLQGITALANETAELIKRSVDAVADQSDYIKAADGSFHSIANSVDALHTDMTQLDSISGTLDASNNQIIDGLANQQASNEEIAANAISSANLCVSNLDDLNGVINELNEIAKIIGSLKDGNVEEMEAVMGDTAIETEEEAAEEEQPEITEMPEELRAMMEAERSMPDEEESYEDESEEYASEDSELSTINLEGSYEGEDAEESEETYYEDSEEVAEEYGETEYASNTEEYSEESEEEYTEESESEESDEESDDMSEFEMIETEDEE